MIIAPQASFNQAGMTVSHRLVAVAIEVCLVDEAERNEDRNVPL